MRLVAVVFPDGGSERGQRTDDVDVGLPECKQRNCTTMKNKKSFRTTEFGMPVLPDSYDQIVAQKSVLNR